MNRSSTPGTPVASELNSPVHTPLFDLESERSDKPDPRKTKHHTQFWFVDGNFTLQAGDTLFKLHKSMLLRAGSMFQDAFALGGPAASGDAEGTDEKPLLVPQTTSDEFDVFCRVVYARWGDDEKLTTPELLKLIRVTARLGAHALHTRAVAKLGKQPLSLADRIMYGKRFGIDGWAESAFVTLVQTLHALSDAEAEKIKWGCAFRVATAQKAVIASRLSRVHTVNQAGCCNNCQSNYVRNAVGQVGLFLCSTPPNSLAGSDNDQAFLNYLRAEIKSRIPNVGQCGQQNCQAWPTAEHIKTWFDFSKEEEMIKKIIDDCL